MSDTAATPLRSIKPLIISAPFGNYIKPQGATPTLGTFTLARRPGRLWRFIRTVRYHPRQQAWTNRLGLRNPGHPWLENRVKLGKLRVDTAIISIHGFDAQQWAQLIERAAALKPLAIELNLSCPNVGEVTWPDDLFTLASSAGSASGVGIIAKLPPVRFEAMARAALAGGVHAFHCCNTIPVDAGGMSGKPLMPKSLECIARVRELAGEGSNEDRLFIIGGGGITTPADIDAYVQAGADRIALGTKCMNPLRLVSLGPLRGLIEHAERRFGEAKLEREDAVNPQSATRV